jgi:hypothetical protein
MSRPLRHVLLALLLLLAQQAGIVHLTTHATQRLREAPAAVDDSAARCAQCVLYASLGASPVPAVAAPACLPPAFLEVPATPGQATRPGPFDAYRSRAPPRTA